MQVLACALNFRCLFGFFRFSILSVKRFINKVLFIFQGCRGRPCTHFQQGVHTRTPCLAQKCLRLLLHGEYSIIIFLAPNAYNRVIMLHRFNILCTYIVLNRKISLRLLLNWGLGFLKKLRMIIYDKNGIVKTL